MTFGERLKELRTAAGMTQSAVWVAAGMPRGTYLKYEQSLVAERVPFSAVVALSKALGTDCTAFADCDMSQPAPPAAPAPASPRKRRGKA